MSLAETAYAKINLALHVRQRRADGYHDLETLFAFVDAGDRLTVAPAPADALIVTGEFAGALTDPFGNIVAKALNGLPHGRGGSRQRRLASDIWTRRCRWRRGSAGGRRMREPYFGWYSGRMACPMAGAIWPRGWALMSPPASKAAR